MAKKTVQKMSRAQIEAGLKMKIEDRLKFVEEFMKLAHFAGVHRSKLISLKVPEDLLKVFRHKCEIEGVLYQSKIKSLMSAWVLGTTDGEIEK